MLTLADYLADREDFLHIYATPSPRGDGGMDVVLRIDGTYYERGMAEAVAQELRRHIHHTRRAYWWLGPPGAPTAHTPEKAAPCAPMTSRGRGAPVEEGVTCSRGTRRRS